MPDYIGIKGLKDLTFAAHQAVGEADQLLEPKDKGKGGYCRLFLFKLPRRGIIDLAHAFSSEWLGGRANHGGEEKYFVYTWEKAIRLAQHYASDSHVSSGQSADASKEQWDGASIVHCAMPGTPVIVVWIVSCSGWPAYADAAIGLRTIQMMQSWYPIRHSLEVAINATKNDFASKLLGIPLAA